MIVSVTDIENYKAAVEAHAAAIGAYLVNVTGETADIGSNPLPPPPPPPGN